LVVLDVREHSNTYGKWESFIISPETQTQVLIPPMFANGHFVMEDDSIFHYKMAYKGEYNDETKQKTIVFNDSRFGIEWPVQSPILSNRDRNGN
jgi:dTDP-4-dehydrorhamnose 3,5-epimerase